MVGQDHKTTSFVNGRLHGLLTAAVSRAIGLTLNLVFKLLVRAILAAEKSYPSPQVMSLAAARGVTCIAVSSSLVLTISELAVTSRVVSALIRPDFSPIEPVQGPPSHHSQHGTLG
jgi:hypothetical protein